MAAHLNCFELLGLKSRELQKWAQNRSVTLRFRSEGTTKKNEEKNKTTVEQH